LFEVIGPKLVRNLPPQNSLGNIHEEVRNFQHGKISNCYLQVIIGVMVGEDLAFKNFYGFQHLLRLLSEVDFLKPLEFLAQLACGVSENYVNSEIRFLDV